MKQRGWLGLDTSIWKVASTHVVVDAYTNIYAPMLPLLIPSLNLSLAAAGGLYRVDVYLTAFDPGNGWRYFPSVGEILITAGIMAVETMVYLFVVRKFPILSAAPPALAASQTAGGRS